MTFPKNQYLPSCSILVNEKFQYIKLGVLFYDTWTYLLIFSTESLFFAVLKYVTNIANVFFILWKVRKSQLKAIYIIKAVNHIHFWNQNGVLHLMKLKKNKFLEIRILVTCHFFAALFRYFFCRKIFNSTHIFQS